MTARAGICSCPSCMPTPVSPGFVECWSCKRQYHAEVQADFFAVLVDDGGKAILCRDFCFARRTSKGGGIR